MNPVSWLSSYVRYIKRACAERWFLQTFIKGVSGPTTESDRNIMELYGLLGKETLSEDEKKRLGELGWRTREAPRAPVDIETDPLP